MRKADKLEIELLPYGAADVYDLDKIIFDLESRIDLLSSQGDSLDYLVAAGSGVLCGMLDVLWVGEFSLERGRGFASDRVDGFVQKTAKLLGCREDDLPSAVRFLEKKFPIPSDGSTPDFGGGLQHHLRDFAHHPTVAGLMFSLLTQFTYKSYGTGRDGRFLVVDVPEASRAFIGKDVPTRLLYGTVIWFFHLVSDMAGSSGTAGKGGGTGIPGPLLSLAKELSVLPFFRSLKVGDQSLSVFLSKLFNGTLLAKHDESGRIIKDTVLRFDLRGELGAAAELGRQAIPVAANECLVRGFYFIRRLAVEVRERDIRTLDGMKRIDWDRVRPAGGPTIARMCTIAAGVFTAVDVGEAVATQKYWLSINYVGVGRFAVAIGEDVSWGLKAGRLKDIKRMYENIRQFVYLREDESIYERIGRDMEIEKLGLTIGQTEILYNLEYHITRNDIRTTKLPAGAETVKQLKQAWLDEWKDYITKGFSSFLQVEGAQMHWYTEQELLERIEADTPQQTWFRLVLLEAMLFEPYYPLALEQDKKGGSVPGRKYQMLQNPVSGFRRGHGESWLDSLFTGDYYPSGYIKRLRRCYDRVLRELNEVLKTALVSLAIAAGITLAAVATAGAYAPAIAVALVGSNFPGLSGAALTAACLAYLGGGAIAAGGAGMAGGAVVIVGGGAVLGAGVGAGVGGAVGAASLLGKKSIILQSAKLLTAVREIFLNDEQDTAYSESIYETYVQNIMEIEKGLVELRHQADTASGEEKKKLRARIKKAEESVHAMKIAGRSMRKYVSSFEKGLENA